MLILLSVLFCLAVRTGPLTLSWANWFTLLGFLILIKPIRERSTFFMLQFNSLDRPEDRPNTLSWIVGGNILPGCIMIIFFKCQKHSSARHNTSKSTTSERSKEASRGNKAILTRSEARLKDKRSTDRQHTALP